MATAAAFAFLAMPQLPVLAGGDPGDAAKGMALATKSCVQCHAVRRHDYSKLKEAPPLRELSGRYPLESLYEAFAEGIAVGHPEMPEFILEPQQIGDLLAYIQSISPADAQ